MLFNSMIFLVFFLIVMAVYWPLVRHTRIQNLFLLISSFVFYGYWDWRFLSLLLISITLDYSCGLGISRYHRLGLSNRAKLLVALSVVGNLSLLITFKYFGFFLDFLREADPGNRFSSLHIIIPIGISFYTFQTMSYSIDIYRKQIEPTRNLIDFALYTCFFPQLVAGPIEKAAHLLPQIQKPRSWNWNFFFDGLFLIIFGLFLKVCVADNLMPFTAIYFDAPQPQNTLTTILSWYSAMFQVYTDFAGYSAMAVGLALLLGFKISFNFLYPYISTSPQEFWPRWHITGVNWFRTYVFHPFSQFLGKQINYRSAAAVSLYVTMILFALWHGFGMTFFIWGITQATLFMVFHLARKSNYSKWVAKIPYPLGVFLWFNLLTFSCVVYRSRELTDMSLHWNNLWRGFGPVPWDLIATLAGFALPVLLIDSWHKYKKEVYFFPSFPFWIRLLLVLILYAAIVTTAVPGTWSFIYYQF